MICICFYNPQTNTYFSVCRNLFVLFCCVQNMYVYNTCSLISIFLYICWCTHYICTHSNVYCTFHKNNIAIYTIQMQNQVEKARIFVSRSYQIKDNTVYYKLYFGVFWHQDIRIQASDLSQLSHLPIKWHIIYTGKGIYNTKVRVSTTPVCWFFRSNNIYRKIHIIHIYSIHLYPLGKTYRNNLGFQYI